jgi:Mn2+/Fe2+ NRAMP family transporter
MAEKQRRGPTTAASDFLKQLGPGLITGASDDDPSGIGTYSQAGAQLGFSIGWTMLLTFPLMAGIQEISARIGRTTGHGIAGNLRRHYSDWLLYPIVGLLFIANTINIGADLSAMGDALKLLVGGPTTVYAILFGTICAVAIVFMDYSRYVLVDSRAKPLVDTPAQAPQAIQRIRADTLVGMAFFNLIALAIIFTTAATLNKAGITDVETSAQAAQALKPVAGNLAFVIFALGIIGTGLLAVPVLAGSAAYAVGEAFKWPVGLSRKPKHAKAFYSILSAATALGMGITLTPLDPIKALYWSAVINGVVAVPVMSVMMSITAERKIMKKFIIVGWLRWLGWTSTAAMAASVVGMVVGWLS